MPEQARLPRTATRRGAVCFAKLLDGVDSQAVDGFGFRGKLYRPGEQIPLAELGENPVLLECTEAEGSHGDRTRKRWESLYIIWRFDRERGEWVELARAQAHASDWALCLRDAARFALGRVSWSIVPKVGEAATRIRLVLDQVLEGLEPSQRSQTVAILHDEFAARIVAGAA